jgi:hypothetical protein
MISSGSQRVTHLIVISGFMKVSICCNTGALIKGATRRISIWAVLHIFSKVVPNNLVNI